MRYISLILLATISSIRIFSQVPAPSSSTSNGNYDMNWIWVKSYAPGGAVIGETKKFFDNNGRPLQDQSKVYYRKNATTVYTHVFASQPLYDVYGRPAAATLAAPIDNSAFIYKSNFVQNSSNTVYDYKNFDIYQQYHNGTPSDKTNAPDAVANSTQGTLGWYYSSNNLWEPYMATTSYPYSRQTFYKDGTGNAKKSGGVGEVFKMGSGHEGSSYVTPVVNELSEYVSIRNQYFSSTEFGELPSSLANKAIQMISRDANGKEAVVVQDRDGKTLMVARPGSELTPLANSVTLKTAYTYSFDGHPAGTSNAKNLIITGNTIKVYESQNGGSSYTEVYSGAASSYSSPSSLVYLYKIESNEAFTVRYDYAIANQPDQAACRNCPSQPGDNSIYYFKMLAAGTVTITGGGYTLYDMSTEQAISFSSGSSLAAGYYKLINTATTPITLAYTNSYSDVSYNFYNQLGQLIATIAPEGVKKLRANGFSAYATKNDIPFISLNEYDVQGRLVKATSTDGGTSEFIYRKDGKIRFSQNAVQRTASTYSYTNYDQYGRPIESGQYDGSGVAFNSAAMTSILENTGFSDGLTGTKTDVIQTIFDLEDATHGQSGYSQDVFYLRGAVSTTKKYSTIVNNVPSSTNLVSQTWYSYDEEGKLVWQIQWINGLGYKTSDFTYDDMGRLIKRVYQKGNSNEVFAHYYEYDPATQNLWSVYTAPANNTSIPSKGSLNGWTLQSTYIYYLHGPLKRIEIGSSIQGIDFTYTLDGKLKAINNAQATKDPGADGSNGFITDAFGEVLDYYAQDYINSRSGVQPIKGVDASSITSDSYNGQIKAMTWFSTKPTGSGASDVPTTYVYNYDDKYQFTESTWGNAINFNNTPATFTTTSINKEKVKNPSTGVPGYDANGNILFLQRTSTIGNPTDNFTYKYLNNVTNTGSNTDYNTNKLESVIDGSTTYAQYTYDATGQLVIENTGDPNKKKYIKYDVAGKVIMVARDQNFTQKVAEYVYNEMGDRIIKRSYSGSPSYQLIQNTYYVGDVIYTQSVSGGVGGTIVAQEYEVDGGVIGRLGVYFRPSDMYAYAMTDHLGNTRAVITKTTGNTSVSAYTDYYPYGMVISTYDPNNYRYGYQGKYAEKDGETEWNAFELRMYDSRIARWLQFDPKGQFFSPYVGMGSDPVNGTDPDGGEANIIKVKDKKGNEIMSLDDGKTEVTFMTVEQLYAKKIQWIEPLADNYMRVLSINPDIKNLASLKHFTWDQIIQFAEGINAPGNFASGAEGDWKKSSKGAAGWIMSEVNGFPYWSDAVGQIPYAIGTYRYIKRTQPNNNHIIADVISAGIAHGKGTVWVDPDYSNTYDTYMILRGAYWANSAYYTNGEGIPRWGLKLFRSSYSSSNLGQNIVGWQAKKWLGALKR